MISFDAQLNGAFGFIVGQKKLYGKYYTTPEKLLIYRFQRVNNEHIESNGYTLKENHEARLSHLL